DNASTSNITVSLLEPRKLSITNFFARYSEAGFVQVEYGKNLYVATWASHLKMTKMPKRQSLIFIIGWQYKNII
ncbi:MAG: hypothetical protein ACK4WQ_07205, partial [Bacteroidota bacterium]